MAIAMPGKSVVRAYGNARAPTSHVSQRRNAPCAILQQGVLLTGTVFGTLMLISGKVAAFSMEGFSPAIALRTSRSASGSSIRDQRQLSTSPWHLNVANARLHFSVRHNRVLCTRKADQWTLNADTSNEDRTTSSTSSSTSSTSPVEMIRDPFSASLTAAEASDGSRRSGVGAALGGELMSLIGISIFSPVCSRTNTRQSYCQTDRQSD